MKFSLSDFDYDLPRELIAAYPPEDRPSARLLKVDRKTGNFSHHIFREVAQFFQPGDVLVLNNTKVRAARIFGTKPTGGKVEALLLKEQGENKWESLLRPGGRIKKGMVITFGENGTRLEAEVLDDGMRDSGQRLIGFRGTEIKDKLDKIGHIPLPPYLDRPDSEIDRTFYQTVFAKTEGAVASPTAGLHFDLNLLEEMHKRGVEIVQVTLHTSYGTFQPIVEEDLRNQKLFPEDIEITSDAAEVINKALDEKRRVIACGTTSVRTLESAVNAQGRIEPLKGQTQLLIYPPYEFKIVSGMITNFHLPKSSLLLLVAALLDGREKLMNVYAEAIREHYRFYSYGDAMVIL